MRLQLSNFARAMLFSIFMFTGIIEHLGTIESLAIPVNMNIENSIARAKFMFTGIIEHLGTIESLALRDDGGRVTIHAPTLASKLAVSNSIAVNGCCLTIVSVDNDHFSADLSGETGRKTPFGAEPAALQKGARVHLEQP